MGIKVGIIGAMQVEIDHLLERLDGAQSTSIAGTDFYEGRLGDVPVVIVRCGVGKVNAAMIAQTAIVTFGATHVINTGVAGGLDRRLHVGDLVISTDAVQHDMDVTGLGYEPGVIPELGERGVLAFEASEQLRSVMARAASEKAPEVTTLEGRIASGDQFVGDQASRQRIVRQFGAACCEMEGAAIAQASWRNGVPFVIVRAISDNADESSTVSYRDFEAAAAKHCAAITLRAVELLA